MPKPTPTTKVRDDHKYRRCNQSFRDGKVCGDENEMTDKQCVECKSKRNVNYDALDIYSRKLGTLIKVDDKGAEWWQYSW